MRRAFRLITLGAIAALMGVPSLVVAGGVPSAPPRPLVKSSLDQAHAARGSYCWTRGRTGICTDTADPLPGSPTVDVEPGERVLVAMGYRTDSLSISTKHGQRLHAAPGPRRHHWRFKVPVDLDHRLGLHLFARYDRGDGSFAIHLMPQSAP
jgi:hypothetical protein